MNPCSCNKNPMAVTMQTGCRNECFFHGCEPLPKEYWRVCVECGHCYVTFEEAMEAEKEILEELNWEAKVKMWPGYQQPMVLSKSVNDMQSCPLCSHDW